MNEGMFMKLFQFSHLPPPPTLISLWSFEEVIGDELSAASEKLPFFSFSVCNTKMTNRPILA